MDSMELADDELGRVVELDFETQCVSREFTPQGAIYTYHAKTMSGRVAAVCRLLRGRLALDWRVLQCEALS